MPDAHGHGHLFEQVLKNRPVGPQGDPQVTADELFHVPDVLHGQRLIEPQLLSGPFDLFGLGHAADIYGGHIAGNRTRKEKHQCAQGHKHDQQADQSSG